MKKDICRTPAPPPERVELSDNPVKLCNEISRLFRARIRETNDADGVMTQPGAHLVLSFLAVKDGITQLELVNATHLRPPTVSVILKRMEEEGIVERKSNPDDMRSLNVYLTDTGRRLDAEKIESIKKIEAVALEGLNEAELLTLMELLSRIRDNLLSDRRSGEDE
jgi:DNA-binding MarR family transcriptional regulator